MLRNPDIMIIEYDPPCHCALSFSEGRPLHSHTLSYRVRSGLFRSKQNTSTMKRRLLSCCALFVCVGSPDDRAIRP